MSFRVSEEDLKKLKLKTLQDGTTIQEVFSGYLQQYLSDKSTVFVKPNLKIVDYEEIKRIVDDTERLLKRVKNVEDGIEFAEYLAQAAKKPIDETDVK